MRRAWIVLLACGLFTPSPAWAAPVVVAERAGPLRDGAPVHPEGSLAAVTASAGLGAVVALDVAVSADGVPLVFADLSLERLTPCAGAVASRPVVELASCPVSWLGTPGGPLAAAPAPGPVPVATLRRALEVAAAGQARVVLGVGPEDRERLPALLAAVPASLPRERLIVSSSDPRVLAAVRSRLRGAARALATEPATDLAGPAAAAAAGHEWVAPGGPVDPAYVAEARARGRRVLARSGEDPAAPAALAALEVDALSTLDPAATSAALGLAAPADAPAVAPPPAAAPELLFPALASDGAASPRVLLRWRAGEGSPWPESVHHDVEVRPRDSTREEDWRALVVDGPGEQATYTGAPGETYDVRARFRPRDAAPGPWAFAPLVVPRDEPSGRGWRRVRRPGAWEGRVALARRPGATLRLRVHGSSVALVAPRSPDAGRLEVRVDGRRFVSSARGPAAARQVIWTSPALGPGAHRLVLRSLGGGPVAVDAIASR